MSTRRAAILVGTATVLAAPAIVRAEATRHLRMVTSWPRNLPGPGQNAQRLADRINAMSGGRLEVRLHAAGELVPPLQVLDAVATGVAEMAHTASFYWSGKARAAVFFTTVPFGLAPAEHTAWIEHGGGQALWDELYLPFGIKPFMAGSSGMQMGGWFKRELKDVADLQGLKIRAAGLSGDLFGKLGATTVVLPVGEIYPALQSGAVDAVEFLGPSSDRASGFAQVAPFYYWPTFTKPNGTAECLIARSVWDGLAPDLRAIVEQACRAENQVTLSESDWKNAEALELLVQSGTQLRPWPVTVLKAARRAADEIMTSFAGGSDIERRIHDSYQAARHRTATWSRVSARAYLEARDLA